MTHKRIFPIEDILTVTTGRPISRRGVSALYDLLGFLVGEVPFTHQIPRISKICAPYLLRQFPQLGGSEIDQEIARLDRQIEGATEDLLAQYRILFAWRVDVAEKFGAMFEVADLPEELRDSRDPIEEMAEMRGKPPIVVILDDSSSAMTTKTSHPAPDTDP